MPGLSFIYDTKGTLQKEKETINKSLETVLHDSAYEINYYLNNDYYILVSTNYREYPVFYHEDENYFLFLEGMIYEEYDSIQAKLQEVAGILTVKNNMEIKALLDNWLQANDGDYIIFIIDKKSKNAYILNDALGRLPLYYFKIGTRIVVSRELSFIAGMLPEKEYDRMSIAQHLLLGYSLGERTILRNVYRALPCFFIQIGLSHVGKFNADYLRTYNFEKKKNADKTIKENAAELEKIFRKSCRNRVNPAVKNVVGLSGGMDSRCIAAGLHKNQIPFSAATRLRYDKSDQADADVAEVIASNLKCDWSLYKYEQPAKGKDLYQIIKRKTGLNNLTLKFMAPFLEDILETYGRGIRFFTGDGGLLLKDRSPVRRLKSMRDLINYTLFKYQVFPVEIVSALTSLPKKQIIDELINHFSSYPEQSFDQKHIHFFIYEYNFKWLFEGEDRNRTYFWSLTPFLSIHFFNYAKNCPDRQKHFYKLYRQFLHTLSSEIALIDNDKWGAPMGSRKANFAVWKNMMGYRHQKLAGFYRNFFKKPKKNNSYNANDCIVTAIEEQAISLKAVSDHLNIELAIKNLEKINKQQFDILFTITSVIELLEKRTSILKKYSDKVFE